MLEYIPLTYYALAGLINFIASFILAIFVLYKNPELRVNRIFFVFALVASCWGLFHFLWLHTIENASLADFFLRTVMLFVIFVPATFTHFILAFLKIDNNKKINATNYLISIVIGSTVYTHLFAKDMGAFLVFPFWLKSGPVFHFHLIHFLGNIIYSHILMASALKRQTGIFRNQVLYVFIGTAIGYTAGVLNYCPWYRIPIPPFLNPFVSVYVIMVAIAILRFRLMDINIALTRASIFLLVYTLVLGIPFAVAGWGKLMLVNLFGNNWFWFPLVVFFVLATAGPFIFLFLQRRAEARMRAEEFHARELLTQAAEGMMRFRSTKKLASLIVHVTCKTLKLDNAAMLLVDENSGKYNLEVVRLKSKYQYLESLDNNDALIQRLSTIDEPIVYEEVKMQSQELKDKPDDPVHEIERQMQALSAAVVIPATSRGRLLGFLVLGEKKAKRMYSKDDLATLWALSYQAALAIENARFHQKAQEELLREDREVTSRFIGHGASHQFGNLLNRVIQRSQGKEMDLEELDLNTLSPEDLKKLILELKGEFSAISKTAFQGKDIVSGILSLGSGSPVEFKEEDLKAIITTAVSTIKLKQSKKTIQDMAQVTEIVTHISDHLPKIYCNSMQLEQVLDNLLDNDLEAIEEKENLIKRGELKEDNFRGRITIETTLENDHILIRLSDNGIGIRPEDQKKVFMPFFTTKATERLSRKGHGIGMHMVKEIIKAHQGKIYIDKTEYTKGTAFVIELPLKVSENKKV